MTEYQDWTVVRLKEELKSQGLSQSGKKSELIQRLLDEGEKLDSGNLSDYDMWRKQGNIPKERAIQIDLTPIEEGEHVSKGGDPVWKSILEAMLNIPGWWIAFGLCINPIIRRNNDILLGRSS